jgi:hypothetical protein
MRIEIRIQTHVINKHFKKIQLEKITHAFKNTSQTGRTEKGNR